MRLVWNLIEYFKKLSISTSMQTSILNRFLCNFAGTIFRYYGNCSRNLAKFDKVLQKLLMRLVWNLIEYFKKLFISTSMQTSILNRFLCNFAGTIFRYYGNCSRNLAKFDKVLQKLLMRLVWNLIEYFKKSFISTSIYTSILIGFPCYFAGTIGMYYGNFTVNLAKFD